MQLRTVFVTESGTVAAIQYTQYATNMSIQTTMQAHQVTVMAYHDCPFSENKSGFKYICVTWKTMAINKECITLNGFAFVFFLIVMVFYFVVFCSLWLFCNFQLFPDLQLTVVVISYLLLCFILHRHHRFLLLRG